MKSLRKGGASRVRSFTQCPVTDYDDLLNPATVKSLREFIARSVAARNLPDKERILDQVAAKVVRNSSDVEV